MSEFGGPASTMRPPDCAPLADNGNSTATLQRPSTTSKVKLVSSVTRRLSKFLNAIKTRSHRKQQNHPSRPAVSLTNSRTATAMPNFNTPSYGRLSEKLTAALSSNTNSGSSVLRGGSDSELPVYQNLSTLPSGESPTGNRSPVWSPSLLGGFSLRTNNQQPQQQQQQHCASEDAPQTSLSPGRTSPSKQSAARESVAAPASAAAVSATAGFLGAEAGARRHSPLYGKRISSSSAVGGSSSFFSCLSGDYLADCDRPSASHHHHHHQHHHQQQQQQQHQQCQQQHHCHHQQQQRSPSILQTQPLPQSEARAVAAAAEPRTAFSGPSVAASPTPGGGGGRCWGKWDAAVAADAAATPFARSSASDGFLQQYLHSPPYTYAQQSPAQLSTAAAHSQGQPEQPDHPLQPHLRALIQQQPQHESSETCVLIRSPGATPCVGSPVLSWLSHANVRKLKAAPVYDRPSAARKLAYRPPEVAAAAAAAAAATRAAGGGGAVSTADGEGRVHRGNRAAAALLSTASCISDVGGGGGGGSSGGGDGGNSRRAPVKRVGSALESAHLREMAATDKMITAAVAAAAATAAAARPTALNSELLIRGQPEPLVSIPFQRNSSSGGGGSAAAAAAAAATVATSCQIDRATATAAAVGHSSAGSGGGSSTSTCSSNDGDRSRNYPVTGAGASAVTNTAATPVDGGSCNASAGPRPSGAVAEVSIRSRSKASMQEPAPPPPPPPSLPCQLLALNPGMPAAMRRSAWSLEDYSVSRRLYKGSTSAVYKAICKRSGLPVALKVYFLNRVPAAVLHMICREIQIQSAVSHPNIISLYAAFQSERHLALVMEYASRGDLYGIHQGCLNRRMDERQVADLVLGPLLDAISYLHSLGYCHRDIKPENVLFTSDWQLKLADFGVSIDLNKERAVTRAGTVSYMAPEVARCPLKVRPDDNKHDTDLAYGTACDIWALGVLTYELLVGFTPLSAPALPPPPASAAAAPATRPALIFPGGISKASRDFVAGALADRPMDRPSAQLMCRHPWIAGRKQAAATAAAAQKPPSPPPPSPPAPVSSLLAPNTPGGHRATGNTPAR
ncbi:Spindle and kinetochore-associated protein 1 [Pleodorina starrii]|uniref:Spindle and kinetochore-associated protein 1 n=1 Tax=Pleodorina starrii TaxID=330485 RepID=A0A9W6BAZ4_9CHLO|nr:Spindle and kinetochore-associated protein 1 [Pleodorina starrii]GLC72545.1 Spindle and kinetochore-associated protein 1 [Pleodorina starrii]